VRYYELHLLALAGYQPQLFRCVQCSEPLQPEVNFLSLARGGALCPTHGANHPGTIVLPLPVLKVLRFLQSRTWEDVAPLQITAATMGQVEAVLKRYIVYHLERSVRSATFLERLRATLAQAEQPAAGEAGSTADG
jgi:DNA repair protein RecO (recombination protein O)